MVSTHCPHNYTSTSLDFLSIADCGIKHFASWHIFTSPPFWWGHPSFFWPMTWVSLQVCQIQYHFSSQPQRLGEGWNQSQWRFFPGFFLSELKRKMALVWEGDYDAQNIIVPWLLGGNLSSAGEAANSPRGRDKWRWQMNKKENVSHWFQAQKFQVPPLIPSFLQSFIWFCRLTQNPSSNHYLIYSKIIFFASFC